MKGVSLTFCSSFGNLSCISLLFGGGTVIEGRSLKYICTNEIPHTWTRQEQVLLLLALMLFHGQLELLQILSHHLNMLILEAVPV